MSKLMFNTYIYDDFQQPSTYILQEAKSRCKTKCAAKWKCAVPDRDETSCRSVSSAKLFTAGAAVISERGFVQHLQEVAPTVEVDPDLVCVLPKREGMIHERGGDGAGRGGRESEIERYGEVERG